MVKQTDKLEIRPEIRNTIKQSILTITGKEFLNAFSVLLKYFVLSSELGAHLLILHSVFTCIYLFLHHGNALPNGFRLYKMKPNIMPDRRTRTIPLQKPPSGPPQSG